MARNARVAIEAVLALHGLHGGDGLRTIETRYAVPNREPRLNEGILKDLDGVSIRLAGLHRGRVVGRAANAVVNGKLLEVELGHEVPPNLSSKSSALVRPLLRNRGGA